MDKGGKTVAKKPYTPPVLTVYGTVRDLTNAVTSTPSHPDGGPFPNQNRTSIT